jgi:hypothetical protein
MQQKNRLRNLEPLEELLFEPTVELLLNKKGGEIVLDDELIGSRAGDAESRNHSQRKAGKDGPVVDAIADSHAAVVMGMRLRLSGESGYENIEKLTERLPHVTSLQRDISLKFDRGYGKLKMLQNVGPKGYNMSTIASESGSHHPFIEHEHAEKYIEQCKAKKDPDLERKIELFKDFVLDGSELGGAQVAYATKEVKLDNGSKLKVYAISIRDVFDKKVAVKNLRFFNTAGGVNDETADLWIALKKDKFSINQNYLFSDKNASANRLFVESTLTNSCQPLTITQRTGDWFLGRRFRLTGTAGSSLSGTGINFDNDDWKSPLMDKCIETWFGRHKSTDAMKQWLNLI